MIINSVRMRNFKSHADTKVGFGTGINVILGENGAGKTSVLEAISFALFKEYEGNLENLVRSSQSSMSVEVVFTSHGRTYKVLRNRTKSGSDARLFVIEDGREKLLQEGDSGVDREIEEILGIDRYLFTNAVYVRQGEIASLLVARPSDRKQLIGRLLGIDVLEKVWERMRPVADRFREAKIRLESGIAAEDRVNAQLREMDAQLSDVRARAGKTEKKMAELSASLEKAEAHEKKLGEAEKKHLETASVYDSVKAMLDRETGRLASARKQAAEISAAEKDMDAVKEKLRPGWKEELERKISEGRKRMSALDEKIGTLKGRISEMAGMGERLEKAGDRCPLCGSPLTEKHRGQLMKEREHRLAESEKEASGLEAEKRHASGEIESLAERKEEMAGLENRRSELRGVISRGETARKAVHDGEALLDELKGKAASLQIRMKESGGSREEFEKARGNTVAIRSELGALREAYGRQQGKLQELENSRERLAKEAEEIGRKKKEHGKLAKFVSMLDDIRKLFDKSGLQKDLRTRSIPVIEMYTKEFFKEFNFDYSDLSLDDNYDVTLYGQGGESKTEMISGGEKIAAALAMRLGIARTLAGGSADSMLLDEPTIYLDSQRRQDLIAVLKRLTVMPQLIVVTHDTAMEEAADKITVIRKERGISFAEDA